MLDYLKVSDLKDGYLYLINARRATHGIWLEENGSFLIARLKFEIVYLFCEVHYDLDDNFGTVKPLSEIENAPFSIERLKKALSNRPVYSDREVLEYLMLLDGIDPRSLKFPSLVL